MNSSNHLPIAALILDMDGVLWRGEEPIGDLPAIFQRIRQAGWQFVLATNNATRSVDQYVAKLASFGVDIRPSQVLNSAVATAQYLARIHPDGGPLYVIGEEGLLTALEAHGFHHDEEQAQAVVVGLDRKLTYLKLRTGTLLIRAGAAFVGTNPDRTFPDPDGLVPGAGALLAALEAATDVAPTVIGKPAPEMFRQALVRLDVEPEQTLVVGDRLETDIAGGIAAGCRTALVLSGVTTVQDADRTAIRPDLVARDLSQLLKVLQEEHVG